MTSPNDRRFRFGLRTMFVVAAIGGVFLGFLGWNWQQVRDREKMLRQLMLEENRVLWAPQVDSSSKFSRDAPFVWRLLGADYVGAINLPRERFDDDQVQRIRSLFPEAEITVRDSE